MKRALLLSSLGASLALLAACGNDSTSSERMDYAPPAAPVVEMEESFASADLDGAVRKQAGANGTQDLPQRAGRFLAYTHNRTITVPSAQLKDLMETHSKTCMDAGPQNCLVSNSSVSGLGSEYARGYLAIKASPDWALPFLDGLPVNLEPLNANVTSSSTSSEDLTSRIIDTDAQLTALKTLRGRLQTLLETRDGDLADLLAVESELARVQGQIDSYEANLANLRQRVSMSDVYLNYEAKVSPASRSVWRPLTSAFEDFFSSIASALGGLVRLLPYLIVWIPVLTGCVWAAFAIWRRLRKGKKSKQTATVETKTEAAE